MISRKGYKIILVALVLFVGLFVITGCKKDPTAGFKNPKTIEYKTDKGKQSWLQTYI